MPAQTSAIAAIRDQFYQTYAPHLQVPYLQMKTEEQFFSLMAQAHNPAAVGGPTPWERKVATEAHELIIRDIREHYTNEEIASIVHVDRGALNRAFRLVYGLGMKEYLIWVRMERSKELLLEGMPIKKVAQLVGYKHSSTFSYEFRKLYHYSPVDFQNGRIK
jgi:AraC-like DNA-binding protein